MQVNIRPEVIYGEKNTGGVICSVIPGGPVA